MQIIQRVLITSTGTSTGDVVVDINTGDNNIYLNPDFLNTTGAYSGNLFLTLDADGYINFASGAGGEDGKTTRFVVTTGNAVELPGSHDCSQ